MLHLFLQYQWDMKRWVGLFHHTVATWHSCVKSRFLNYSGLPSHACITLTGGTFTGFCYMKCSDWNTVETRWENWRRNWFWVLSGGTICVLVILPFSTLEMCLNCGVFIGPTAEMQASAAACAARSQENMLVFFQWESLLYMEELVLLNK